MEEAVVWSSSTSLYNQFKFGPLIAMGTSLFFAYIEFDTNGWNDWSEIVFFSLLAILFGLLFASLHNSLTEVEISKSQIVLVTKNLTVQWKDVKSVKFKWYGLYRIVLEEDTFYFPPYGNSIRFFGLKMPDEFDEIIDRRKKEYHI